MKPRVYPFGADQPEPAIGSSQRVDFHVGHLDDRYAHRIYGGVIINAVR